MRWKKIEKTEWRRVFVFWPKGTMDGFKISFSYVWKRTVPIEDDHGLSLDSYVVDEYHTNPDGLEDEYQNGCNNITQVQIGGNNSQTIQSNGDLYINGKKYAGSGSVLTEGVTLHHPKRPPPPARPPKRTISDTIQSPKRPKRPPPPAPPPIRVINEDVKFDDIFKWIDKHMEAIDDFMDGDAKKKVEKNEKMLKILEKRKNVRDAKDMVKKWRKKRDDRLHRDL